jgi:hypothetical protein
VNRNVVNTIILLERVPVMVPLHYTNNGGCSEVTVPVLFAGYFSVLRVLGVLKFLYHEQGFSGETL